MNFYLINCFLMCFSNGISLARIFSSKCSIIMLVFAVFKSRNSSASLNFGSSFIFGLSSI